MALPPIKTVQDGADWANTVEPFLPQLFELPGKVAARASSLEALQYLYIDTNPVVSGFAFSVFLGFVFLIVSEINKNYSQVDRMWSLLPTIYNAHFVVWTHLNELPTRRVDLVLLWSVVWSIRLTFNYWRRGGYQIGSEDYRWEIVQSKVYPFVFFLFNVTFISFIQSVLLFAIAVPTYGIMLASQRQPEATLIDFAFTALQLGLVTIEWFGDQQQWTYQNAKKQYQKTAKVPAGFTRDEVERGFRTTGLWAYCRHPSFSAEQSIWLTLYVWSCVACGVSYSWMGSGVAGLILLFQGSTWLTERITASKYPDYKHYQQHVGMQIPTLTAYKPPAPVPKSANNAGAQKPKHN